jgi:hypothetical protein
MRLSRLSGGGGRAFPVGVVRLDLGYRCTDVYDLFILLMIMLMSYASFYRVCDKTAGI